VRAQVALLEAMKVYIQTNCPSPRRLPSYAYGGATTTSSHAHRT
jgi:hypothetical protein